MKTRTSNRTKTFTVEKYDFDVSSEEEKPRRRRKNAEEKDENFDETAQVASPSRDEQPAVESDASLSVAEESEAEDRFSRQRVKPIKPFNVRAVGATGYVDLETMPPDGHPTRSYAGPFDRTLRGQHLLQAWYGPQKERMRLAQHISDRWMPYIVLPPKTVTDDTAQSDKGLWAPNFVEKQAYYGDRWYSTVQEAFSGATGLSILSPEQAQPYQLPRRSMPVLLGPLTDQREIMFEPGDAYSLTQAGIPFDQDEYEAKTPVGWMFDVGGIVIGMDWAPRTGKQEEQILALAIIPHADQEDYNHEEESMKSDFQRYGIVQLWCFASELSSEGFIRPSRQRPRRRKTLCIDYGRARRVLWSPVCSLLAILCGDGMVCVVEAGDGEDEIYEKVESPLAVLVLNNEDDVKATAMTWVTFNRLAIGYSDGSIALWSIYPSRLLSRHPVHHSPIVDMVSGYPTLAHIIASTSIGGTAKLIDLQSPSHETTEVQSSAVHTQPNLMGYSDHMLGFYSLFPSASVINTMVAFMHHANFPVVRRIFTADSFLSCLSVGRTHPFLLIGTQDGSLWGVNPQVQLYTSRRGFTNRLRIFQHEHRPAELFTEESPAAVRGAARLLQNFVVDSNRSQKAEGKTPAKKGGKKPKKKDDVGDDINDDDEAAVAADPSRGIIYDATTRVTVVEWNPNDGFGCWAAAAMASGLVRVLDLGLEVAASNESD